MKTLNNFNNICDSLILEQDEKTPEITTTTEVEGGDAKITQDGNNINIDIDIPSDEITEQVTVNNQNSNINELKTLLQNQLIDVSETSKTARNYAQHAGDDKAVVMYNYGFAEGQKKLIKFILKRLNEISGE